MGWQIVYLSPILFFSDDLGPRILLTLILGLIYLFFHAMAFASVYLFFRIFWYTLIGRYDEIE